MEVRAYVGDFLGRFQLEIHRMGQASSWFDSLIQMMGDAF